MVGQCTTLTVKVIAFVTANVHEPVKSDAEVVSGRLWSGWTKIYATITYLILKYKIINNLT